MTEQRKEILRDLKALSAQIFGEGQGKAWLYGSQAKGTASRNSDWDILVVINDKFSTPDDFEKFAMPFAEIGWLHSAQITPIHFTASEWEQQRPTLFYKNVTSSRLPL